MQRAPAIQALFFLAEQAKNSTFELASSLSSTMQNNAAYFGTQSQPV
jgi:hypothetical protein